MANRHDFTDDPRGWHIDTLASEAVVGYRPSGFIADQLMPPVAVTKQSNVYAKVNQADWWRRPNTDKPLGARANEVHFTVGSDTYFCRPHGLETYVPWATMDNADTPLRPVRLAGYFLKDQFAIDYEIAVKDRITSGVGSSMTLTGGNAWDDFINSNPMGNIETAWEAIRTSTGMRANTAVVPEKVWLKVRRHPHLLRAAFPGGTVGGILTTDRLAELMQVERVLIGRTIAVTSVPGTPETALAFSDVWSTNVHLLHVNPLGGEMTATFGVAFRWSGPNIGTSGNPQDIAIESKEDDDREVTRFRGKYWQDEKIVAPQLGFSIVTGITA